MSWKTYDPIKSIENTAAWVLQGPSCKLECWTQALFSPQGLPPYCEQHTRAWPRCSARLEGSHEHLVSVSFPCGFTLRPHKFTLNFRFKWIKKKKKNLNKPQLKRLSKPLLIVGEPSLTAHQVVLNSRWINLSCQWMLSYSLPCKQNTATHSLFSAHKSLDTTTVFFQRAAS